MPWVIFISILYLIISILGSGSSNSDTDILDVALSQGKSMGGDHPKVIQAFVYIAMGAMAKESLTEYSIASLRKVGEWKGRIYILTDNPSCFTQAIKAFDVVPAKVPVSKASNLMEIKSLKATLFEYLPIEINSVIYLDVDIMIQRSVGHFLMDIGHSLTKMEKINGANSFDIGAFPDAQGHYLGFCSGCEKWHTGVLLTKRNSGNKCLNNWKHIISSGKYDTDQESLDEAEANGSCKNTLTMPPSYLLFAKDYIGMALTNGHTFLHVTAAGRPEQQGFFYKNIIMPNLRGKLEKEEDLKSIEKSPQCINAKIGK